MKWQVLYKDGSVHTEEELKEYANIDRDQIKEFALYDGSKIVFVIVLDDDKKLIFRKRKIQRVSTGKAEEPQVTLYLCGYNPKKGKPVLFYVNLNGGVMVNEPMSDADLDNLILAKWEKWNEKK